MTARSPVAAWAASAGALGFIISAVFSSLLQLPRSPFVLAHASAVGLFAALFVERGGLDRSGRRWHTGYALLAGLALGGILVQGVISQPSGTAPRGLELAAGLAWYGLVYGAADALLLTIIPVRALTGSEAKSTGLPWRRVAALASSLLVTALYHAGFEEFRGASLLQPLIGNAIVTIGYLLTGNPATPLVAHAIMHGAAVLHGMEGTTQLPPHY